MSTKVIFTSYDDFVPYIGREIGISSYFTVTQKQIDLFARATCDEQWIHVDTERAARESPFGCTIAHGYLTLSLIPFLWNEIAEVRNSSMMINYGIEHLRFGQPVRVNDHIRMRVALKNITNLKGIAKTEMDVTMEIKDNKRPALTATVIFLYHFK
jgi:acyl dehydratase